MSETRSRFIIKDGQLFIEARPTTPVTGEIGLLYSQIQQQKQRIAELEKQLAGQVEYTTSLQRAIEHYCNGQVIQPDIASKCPHHADKLNAKAAVGRESYDLYSKRLAASIKTGARIAELRNDMKEAWERFDK
jgi:cell division septum initiation protein DivIVA